MKATAKILTLVSVSSAMKPDAVAVMKEHAPTAIRGYAQTLISAHAPIAMRAIASRLM
jgi:hypothetical protein